MSQERGSAELADQIAALRDQVLPAAGEREPPGAELFDAVVRLIGGRSRVIEEIDVAVNDALARRLAWGDSERMILADTAAVSQRLMVAAQALGCEAEELVALAVAEAGASVARVMILAVLSRVVRERAAHLREELAQERLILALERQRLEIDGLEAQLGRTS